MGVPAGDEANITHQSLCLMVHFPQGHWIPHQHHLQQDIEAPGEDWLGLEEAPGEHWVGLEDAPEEHWVGLEDAPGEHWVGLEEAPGEHWMGLEEAPGEHCVGLKTVHLGKTRV